MTRLRASMSVSSAGDLLSRNNSDSDGDGCLALIREVGSTVIINISVYSFYWSGRHPPKTIRTFTMLKVNLNIFYTSKNENTQVKVKVNFESSVKQNDQSQEGWLGLVLDYLPLVVSFFGPTVVQIFSDWFVQMF